MNRLTKYQPTEGGVPYVVFNDPDPAYCTGDHWQDALQRLAAYEDTGRTPEEIKNAIFPPCKVGDTVYVLVKEGKIKKYIVSGIIIDQNNTWIDTREIDNPYGGGLLNALQFGTDVFLTREEAEAALGGDGDG